MVLPLLGRSPVLASVPSIVTPEPSRPLGPVGPVGPVNPTGPLGPVGPGTVDVGPVGPCGPTDMAPKISQTTMPVLQSRKYVQAAEH